MSASPKFVRKADIIVIGGGAAGFFAAAAAAAQAPHARILLLEKTSKVLAKVKISGGGRCNVTHACFDPVELSKHYPRGQRELAGAFRHFQAADTVQWFESRGVRLKTEEDGRMFPTSDDSQTIIDCLIGEIRRAGVELITSAEVQALTALPDGWQVDVAGQPWFGRRVIVTTGGSPKSSGLDWLRMLGHEIQPPVPSLFTFNMPANPVTALMGVSVPHARVRLKGDKLQAEGPLLITHWGMSGPAVLRLSAWGARWMADRQYRFVAIVNWLGDAAEEPLRQYLMAQRKDIAKRQIANRNPFGLPERLWDFLCQKSEIAPDKIWGELTNKDLNRLLNALIYDEYAVSGKTTFKDEFVTCGGVSLRSIDMRSMQSKAAPGLYFAGEILDIDGITGGFNFQAAWTTGWIAGRAAAASLAPLSV